MPERMTQVLLTALRRQQTPQEPVEVEVTDAATALAAVDDAVLATMYGNSPVGIAVLDPTGRYLRINDLLARHNGPTPAEHVGRTLEDVLRDSAAPVRAQLQRMLARGEPVTGEDVVVVDVHGTPRTWQVTWFPAREPRSGRIVAAVCVASEVSEARRGEERTRVLARSGELLAAGLRTEQVLDAIVDLLVPALADWCAVHLVGPGEVLEEARVVHRDLDVDASGGDPEVVALMRRLDTRGALSVPLRARGRTFGAVTVGRSAELTDADDELVEHVARRAALALDNARLYEQVREVAVTLQRSLLPRRLPDVAGVRLASRYLPGADGTEVGGDFYDAVALPGGRIGLTVGDVMGRGVRAAAVMGQLRASLRGYALENHPPQEVLARVDALVQALEDGELVTALYGVLDPGSGVLTVASAGHPAPVLVRARGQVGTVDLDPGPPLGVDVRSFGVAAVRLEPGDTLLLFTDGLVEDRALPVYEGIEMLRAGLDADARARSGDPDAVCAAALETMGRGPRHDDDIALLAVTVEDATA
jgi:PAS domain S-box-containing protein